MGLDVTAREQMPRATSGARALSCICRGGCEAPVERGTQTEMDRPFLVAKRLLSDRSDYYPRLCVHLLCTRA